VKLLAHAATDIGRTRSGNEDAHLVDPALGLYMVCDGMGGHAAGEVASATACRTVQRELARHRASLDAVIAGREPADLAAGLLRGAVVTASEEIHALGDGDKDKRGMGTTCTALLVLGAKAVMAHVGDSRVYLLRGGQLYQMSEDHTFLAEAIRHGVLTHAQAAGSTHGNVVTRAVGPQPNVQVDVLIFDILPGDTLLLCSDGLHQYTPDARELMQLLARPVTASLAHELMQLANARGGVDNITAVLLHASAEAALTPEESSRASQVHAQLETLRRVSLFRDMTLPELARVLHVAHPAEVSEGELVVREGDATESLYILVEGAARVQRGGQTVADLEAGRHFGEMALLNRRPRTATVIARLPSRMLVLDRDAFSALMAQEPLIAAKFLWALSQSLSLRLDDATLVQERAGESSSGSLAAPPTPSMMPTASDGAHGDNPRATARFGTFPSPFARRS
jgi:serine/threonine protein phosphatase PrpC